MPKEPFGVRSYKRPVLLEESKAPYAKRALSIAATVVFALVISFLAFSFF